MNAIFMKEELKAIKNLINEGKTSLAIESLNQLAATDFEPKDDVYYLLGNAYRKQNDWQGALNNYQDAISINPESPAKEAREMMMDILNFYNKDMFNQ